MSTSAASVSKRRGLIVRDHFNHGHQGEEFDPAEIEADRLHDAAVSGCDIHYVGFDKMAIEDPMYCNMRFLDEVKRRRPDFIFYHPNISSYLVHRNVRPEFLYIARSLLGTGLVFSFGDAAYPEFAAYAAGYAAIGDVSVTWDGHGATLSAFAPGRTVLDLWAPANSRLFRDLARPRDLDVSFIGQVEKYRDRRDMLAALADRRLHVHTAGGEQGRYVSSAEYVELLNRSKITLNFSRIKDHDIHQIKARAIEAVICGALLFESENEVTSRYLVPYKHYIPFGDADDLVAKIRRYLADDAARHAIVDAAQAHVATNMSDTVWWRRILTAIDRSRMEAVARRRGLLPA